jgi:hypothetical protein
MIMAGIQVKRPYTTRPGMDAFSFSIMAICSCSDVNFELENSLVKKRYLFHVSANLQRFLCNCSMSAASSIPSLHDKTSLYEHQDGAWEGSRVTGKRSISTVILNENAKMDLLKDIKDFLDQTAREWYSDRGIPYRRGYLLYGLPGTGKSSFEHGHRWSF